MSLPLPREQTRFNKKAFGKIGLLSLDLKIDFISNEKSYNATSFGDIKKKLWMHLQGPYSVRRLKSRP